MKRFGLWLTNTTEGEADQLGYSLGAVEEGRNAELISRKFGDDDVASNQFINFGFAGNGGNVAFMLVGGERNSVGQPLPGAFATLLVAGGVGTALTRKNRKREEE
jgi:hypothetical protein